LSSSEIGQRASQHSSVLLSNGWYIENYAAGIAAALSLGAVYGCAENGRISSATRADYAELPLLY
jgi:NAD(P)H dehydrogenase (quinone)